MSVCILLGHYLANSSICFIFVHYKCICMCVVQLIGLQVEMFSFSETVSMAYILYQANWIEKSCFKSNKTKREKKKPFSIEVILRMVNVFFFQLQIANNKLRNTKIHLWYRLLIILFNFLMPFRIYFYCYYLCGLINLCSS